MKLNKPTLTRLNIVIIVILLITGVISLFANIMVKKNTLYKGTNKNIICNLIKKDEGLINYFNDKKIPVESLDYISNNDCDRIKDKIFDNIKNDNKKDIDYNDIKSIIRDSIIEYELRTNDDIYEYIDNDLDNITKDIANKFNDELLYEQIEFISDITNNYVIIFIIVIVLIVLLIIVEKFNSTSIVGTLLLLSSIGLYYLLKEVTQIIYRNVSIIKLLDIDLNKVSSNTSLSICSILFATGALFLIMYLAKVIKKFFKEARIAYINNRY